MRKLHRKTKELIEATLIIGVACEGVGNSSHDDKKDQKDKIKMQEETQQFVLMQGSIDNLTNGQFFLLTNKTWRNLYSKYILKNKQ